MRRLIALAACACVLGACAVAFNLLYLFVPEGLEPYFGGFAPGIGAAYARWLPRGALALTPAGFTAASAALLAGMWSAFLAAGVIVERLQNGPHEKAAVRLIAGAGAGIALVLVLTPSTLSSDLYHYALFGRMVITRGLNPYVTPGAALVGDPLLPLAGWCDFTSHYGPVFTGLSIAAAWVGRGGPIATALAFKTMAVAGGALTAWSVMALARQGGRSGLLPLFFVAWSPLALLETAGSGHNELVMTGIALFGLVMIGRGRNNLGFALMVASVHVKWITAALAGLVVVAQLRELDGLSARARLVARLAAIAVGITIAAYLPFWSGLETMRATRRLLAAGDNAAADALSPSALIAFVAIVIVAIAVVARTGRRFVVEMSASVALTFVMFVFHWFFPWYLLPAAALLAAGPRSVLNRGLTVLVTCGAVILMAFWAVLTASG
jgi:hypothetical protein